MSEGLRLLKVFFAFALGLGGCVLIAEQSEGLQILIAFFVGLLAGGWCGWYHGAERFRNKQAEKWRNRHE